MKRMRSSVSPVLLAAALVVIGGIVPPAAAGPANPKPAAAKPWVLRDDCYWWLSGEDGKSHRASITRGETEIMLSFSDRIFAGWPMEDRPAVELLFDGDFRKRVQTVGWATHGSDGWGSFGVELDAAARRKLAGASSFELRREGRLIMLLSLAGTPDREALEACVPPPKLESSDEE